MKYRAKGTIEAVQLNDPLEVANWFARVLPEWKFININHLEYRVVRPDRVLPSEYLLDGRWMILSEGDTKPFAISDEFFRLRFEPVPSPFATGGFVSNPFGPFQKVARDAIPKETIKIVDRLKEL